MSRIRGPKKFTVKSPKFQKSPKNKMSKKHPKKIRPSSKKKSL
jgi:hypothetical protein